MPNGQGSEQKGTKCETAIPLLRPLPSDQGEIGSDLPGRHTWETNHGTCPEHETGERNTQEDGAQDQDTTRGQSQCHARYTDGTDT